MTDTLTAGSIAFTGFNASPEPSFNFVALTGISAGTTINFTDTDWKGSQFGSAENTWTWTATADVAAGTVITVEHLAPSQYGQPVQPTSNLGTVTHTGESFPEFSSEALYAYTGDASAPNFLAAFANAPFSPYRSTLQGTGLVEGASAIDVSGLAQFPTIAAYHGPTSGFASFADYQAALNNAANWSAQGGTDSNGHDGIDPDLPLSTAPFTTDTSVQTIGFALDSIRVSTNEGQPGDHNVLTFKVLRSGPTDGAVDFHGTLQFAADSGIDADDFGGTLPAFSGTIADGATYAIVTIPVSGDIRFENDETFSIVLDQAVNSGHKTVIGGSSVAYGTIVNDDLIQTVGFDGSSQNVQVTEGDSGFRVVTFTVVRSGSVVGDLNFTAGLVAGGTVNADDFGGTLPTAISGVIKDGEASATFSISVAGDTRYENSESFQIKLLSASNAPVGATVAPDNQGGVANVTIVNDDPVPSKVGAGETIEGQITVTGTDHFVIDAGGLMNVPGAGSAFLWKGNSPGVVIDNSGTISAGYAIKVGAPASKVQGFLTLNNLAGGVIDAQIQFANLRSGATATINNAGRLPGNGTYAVVLDTNGGTVILNNLATGVITNASSTSDVIRGGDHATVNNWGRIVSVADTSDAKGGDAYDIGSGLNVVHNYAGGWIEGSHHAVTGGNGITVINEAGGTMVGRNGSAINMDNDASPANAAHVTNYGTLRGDSANYDDSDGDAIDTDGLLFLDNYGTIRGEGANGVHKGGANVSEGLAIGGGVINNYAGGTVYGYGRAIQVDDSNQGPALAATTIYNEGTIQGDGHGPQNYYPGSEVGIVIAGREAIDVLGSFADTITNKGQIIGGVFTDGGDDVVTNSGTITATGGSAVDLGAGDDSLTNAGTIKGDVLLGDGDDFLNLVTGSSITGTIDGGAGNDTLTLSGTGTGSIAGNTVTGFEHLVVAGGTWDVGNNPSYADIDVKSGAAIETKATQFGDALILTGSERLTVERGGSVTAYMLGHNQDGTIAKSSTTAVTLAGAENVAIDNAGTIDGIAASFNGRVGPSGTVKITNEATGVITDSIALKPFSSTIDNSGQIIGSYTSNTVAIYAGKNTTLVNHAGGLIGTYYDQDVIQEKGGTLNVDNAGVIRNQDDPVGAFSAGRRDAIAYTSSGTGTVHNEAGGWIEGSHHAVSGKVSLTVINDAGGTMIGRNGSAVNVDNDADPADTVYVTNHGTMLGESAGYADSDGDAIDTDGLLQLDNYGAIKGLGANGYHKGEANISEGLAIGGGSVHNYAGAMIYGYGRAIQVDDSSNGPAFDVTTIVNDGTIQGDGHGPTGLDPTDTTTAPLFAARIKGGEAIDIVGDYDNSITNSATGQIIGGVKLDAGNDTLVNAGTITATGGSAVSFGGGNDTFTNSGTIKGDVLLGDGDDTVTLAKGSVITGMLNLGAGNDTVIVGTGTLVAGSDIEGGDGTDTLALQGGGTFDLRAPKVLTGIELISAQEGRPAYGTYVNQVETIYLRDGLDLTVNVAAAAASGNPKAASIVIYGARDASVINLGSGNDTVVVGDARETVHGGSGVDAIYVTGSTIGATIDGGSSGRSSLLVSGGGAIAMGANITNIATVSLSSATTAYDFSANSIAGLTVTDSSTNADTIRAGGLNQTLTGGAAGKLTMVGVAGGATTFKNGAALLNGDTIKGFDTTDFIDVTGLSAVGTTAKFVQDNHAGANTGTLDIYQNGQLKSAITLFGQFANSFTTAADGAGTGTLVTYVPPATPHLTSPAA